MGSKGFWRRAEDDPGWIAVVDPDGTEHTAGDLLSRVNQLTHALRARGLKPGDGIASLLPNGSAPLEVYLAALQAGWYLTPLNWHFTAPEAAYIAADCGAKAFFADERLAKLGIDTADQAGIPADARFSFGDVPGFTNVADLRGGHSRTPCRPSGPQARPCTTPPGLPGAPRAFGGA